VFQPRRGKAEWRYIYDELLVDADFGDIITYQALSDCLERDFARNRAPIYRATRELGEVRHRWLIAEPGVGYRVIEANEHVYVAQAHKVRGQRQFSRMIEVDFSTDLAALTDAERDQWDRQNRINFALFSVVSAHEKRLARIEEILRDDGKL
jgi:hypothetical protein